MEERFIEVLKREVLQLMKKDLGLDLILINPDDYLDVKNNMDKRNSNRNPGAEPLGDDVRLRVYGIKVNENSELERGAIKVGQNEEENE